MKLVKEIPAQDLITPNQVTMNDLIIMVTSNKDPYILTKDYYEDETGLRWLSLSGRPTTGNSLIKRGRSLQEMLGWGLDSEYTIGVFKGRDWKQALQWLIDNA